MIQIVKSIIKHPSHNSRGVRSISHLHKFFTISSIHAIRYPASKRLVICSCCRSFTSNCQEVINPTKLNSIGSTASMADVEMEVNDIFVQELNQAYPSMNGFLHEYVQLHFDILFGSILDDTKRASDDGLYFSKELLHNEQYNTAIYHYKVLRKESDNILLDSLMDDSEEIVYNQAHVEQIIKQALIQTLLLHADGRPFGIDYLTKEEFMIAHHVRLNYDDNNNNSKSIPSLVDDPFISIRVPKSILSDITSKYENIQT